MSLFDDWQERTYYGLEWCDTIAPDGWRIFEHSFSGRRPCDDRRWDRADIAAAREALDEFKRADDMARDVRISRPVCFR